MKKAHYSWIVCTGCTLQLFITAGMPCAAFGVHLPYLIAGNGFTNTQGALIVTIRTISILLAMLMTSRFYRIADLRKGLLCAAIFGALGFSFYALASNLLMHYIGAILTGLSNGLGGMIPVSILIRKWFCKDSALTLSICSEGSGVATIILPPLLSNMIAADGLQTTFGREAIFMAASSAVVFLLLRNSPEDMHLLAYGADIFERNI